MTRAEKYEEHRKKIKEECEFISRVIEIIKDDPVIKSLLIMDGVDNELTERWCDDGIKEL